MGMRSLTVSRASRVDVAGNCTLSYVKNCSGVATKFALF